MAQYADGWFQAEPLGDDVVMICEARIKADFRANIWFVAGRDCNMLVDSGFGIVSLTRHIDFLSKKPTLVVATHSHCDHIGGHHEFASRAIHSAESDILRNPSQENTAAKGYVSRDMFVNPEDHSEFVPANYSIVGCEPTRLLSEGDILDLGNRAFEVLHVPGHSPGGIVLYEAKTGVLFSGDMVHNGPAGIGRYYLYHSDLEQWLVSVDRLMRIPVSVVHGGHYGSFGLKRYLEILQEYVERRRTPGFPLILNPPR